MVYGRGILMIEAARWLAQRRLLAVWHEPTPIHLISRENFCAACAAAIRKPEARGIYHLGDEGRIFLQEFLAAACRHWQVPPPQRMPLWLDLPRGSVLRGVRCSHRLSIAVDARFHRHWPGPLLRGHLQVPTGTPADTAIPNPGRRHRHVSTAVPDGSW